MTSTPTVQANRPQIAKMCDGDARLTQQMERVLGQVAGQSVDEDVILDATGTIIGYAAVVGVYFVDLLLMFTVVGGSAGNGWSVDDASTATISAGSYAVVGGDSAATVAAPLARPGPYATGIDNITVFMIRGFISVTRPGFVGFLVTKAGAPASATLLAGSGVMLTRVA